MLLVLNHPYLGDLHCQAILPWSQLWLIEIYLIKLEHFFHQQFTWHSEILYSLSSLLVVLLFVIPFRQLLFIWSLIELIFRNIFLFPILDLVFYFSCAIPPNQPDQLHLPSFSCIEYWKAQLSSSGFSGFNSVTPSILSTTELLKHFWSWVLISQWAHAFWLFLFWVFVFPTVSSWLSLLLFCLNYCLVCAYFLLL